MSQPVKLSDALVLDARLAGEVEKRSIAGQVEYWASLGKLIDALIDGRTRADALQRSATKPLSELVATIGTPEGDARLKAYLESEPFPHFEPHPTRKGMLIRTERDGSRSIGRFVDREFVAKSVEIVGSKGSRDKEVLPGQGTASFEFRDSALRTTKNWFSNLERKVRYGSVFGEVLSSHSADESSLSEPNSSSASRLAPQLSKSRGKSKKVERV